MRDLRERLLTLLVRDTNASEIAEAAFVLPLMFMMLLGIFWFGEAFSLYGAITRAAQEGARAGAAPPCSTCSTTLISTQAQNAVDAVKAAMIASNLDPKWMQTTPPPGLEACPGFKKQSCSGTGAACVQLPVELLTDAQGGGDCGISVHFQYPFQLALPFASIGSQKIMLTASARMRMETR